MLRSLTPGLLMLALCTAGIAAQGETENRDALLRKLAERVESLEAEVKQLRGQKAHPAKKTTTKVVPPPEEEVKPVPTAASVA